MEDKKRQEGKMRLKMGKNEVIKSKRRDTKKDESMEC